jgi:hypothetical protein
VPIKKMTDHGSQPTTSNDIFIPVLMTALDANTAKRTFVDIFCDFCGKPCSNFLRRDFLRSSAGAKSIIVSSWPSGP